MTTLFRVHFVNGQHKDVTAENPQAAKAVILDKQPDARITKIKVVRGD